MFTQEHDELRRSLQKFIAAEINPHVDEWEKAGIFPAHELFKKMGSLGFLGLNKPEAFGGAGLDYSFAMTMAEELGGIACGGVPMAIGVQTDMATPALARFGSDEVRKEFLERIHKVDLANVADQPDTINEAITNLEDDPELARKVKEWAMGEARS